MFLSVCICLCVYIYIFKVMVACLYLHSAIEELSKSILGRKSNVSRDGRKQSEMREGSTREPRVLDTAGQLEVFMWIHVVLCFCVCFKKQTFVKNLN